MTDCPGRSAAARVSYGLEIDELLLDACVSSTRDAYGLAGLSPVPVGASKLITGAEEISVIVSLVGVHAGNVVLNLSRRVARAVAERMLEEPQATLSADVFDCVAEVGNVVAGRFKDQLHGTRYEVESISLPAVVLGSNTHLYHSRGLITASATFELEELPVEWFREKFVTTSVTLMRRTGVG